jgi:hypothetical protein
MFRCYPIFILLALLGFQANSQNLTGVWEGVMEDEFIQVNIQQKGNQLCGYTYDYVLNDRSSYCIAKFEGNYDPENKHWYITGSSFIANSGSHILMKISFWFSPLKPKKNLNAVLLMRGGINIPMTEPFELRKVANNPYKMPKWAQTEPCFPPPPAKTTRPAPKAQQTPSPKPTAPKPAPKSQPVKPKPAEDSGENRLPTEKQAPPPVAKKDEPAPPSEIVKNMVERKQTEQSHLTVNTRHINLKLYDNGIVDSDTVSVFYNGKLLVSHQRLSDKAIELDIDLDPSIDRHEITMFAENLGSIPPNTALIVVTAGKKRYELHSKASLVENAVLVFDYKPEEQEKK